VQKNKTLFQVTQKHGERLDTGRAFLSNLLPNCNLTLRTDSVVDRLLLRGNRVDAVQLADGSLVRGGQFVLCSGAIGSPGENN